MDASASFLNLPALLESSRPRPRSPWIWYLGGAALLLVLLVAHRTGGPWAELLSSLVMLGFFGALAALNLSTVRRARQERQQLEAVEELIQLRRWPEAAAMLEQLLSRPREALAARVQGLIYLGSVLARYHRFADVVNLYDELLAQERVDPATEHGLRLGRAMALLHEDRLFDADRAIADLRRGGAESAGLALVEIYRDVKTGHPQEALELFERRLPQLRQQLGHRLGDAYALAARARDLLGQREAAQAAYDDATRLVAPVELHRRYPELASLASTYVAAEAPAPLT